MEAWPATAETAAEVVLEATASSRTREPLREARRLSRLARARARLYNPGVQTFTLTSTAFAQGDPIPQRHTCEDVDDSPPLAWTDPPEGARSLVLVCDDPDAPGGTFTHWLAWGLEAKAGALAEGQAAPLEGENDFGTQGYRGPCPPRGHGPHRYSFRLYALDAELELPSGTEKRELERALEGHSLGVAELVGTFERS